MKDILHVLARVFIATIFIYEAYDSVLHYTHTKETMTAYGITWNQDLLLKTTIVILLLGGALLVIGYRVGLASFILLLYIVPVTFIVYSFWNAPIDDRPILRILFMKNIAIIGGLISLGINTPGKWSIRRLLDVRRLPG